MLKSWDVEGRLVVRQHRATSQHLNSAKGARNTLTVAKVPLIVVALPFAHRDGVDKYNGVMRYLRESGEEWNLRIIRHSFGVDLFRDFPVEKVDGVICGLNTRPGIMGYEPYFNEDVLDLLISRKVPVVGVDLPDNSRCAARNGGKCAFISMDSEKIGRRAAQYLVKDGAYTSFGFVGAFSDRAWSRDRGAFFARELRRLGHRDVHIFQGEHRQREAELLAWLKELPKPAAVFASNDHCADAVLRVCAGGGVRVPDDLAVLGVDDDPIFCIHTHPSLSSLHPDFEAEGHLAAQTLSKILKGRRVRAHQLVGGDITVTARMSTAPYASSGRLVRRADEIIAERACAGLNADVIAGLLGISRRLLDLRYRQIKGRTVRESIEDTRMAQVRRLLSGTRLSHREIARSCGFRSESYMEHVFAKRFGQSMRDYRNAGTRTP